MASAVKKLHTRNTENKRISGGAITENRLRRVVEVSGGEDRYCFRPYTPSLDPTITLLTIRYFCAVDTGDGHAEIRFKTTRVAIGNN
ncbi:hypothetical protein B5X24_HaOG202273 [Helicoverpa armigera]|uniref:Uncharacterized protein n=1 Tax=Helicoverpa armigera TaxID=29058 RepID=A0A2W1BYQ4_HELAM|nr:hypothetical protein B5X24_HaOG202273 [Helicoverpa armigera]